MPKSLSKNLLPKLRYILILLVAMVGLWLFSQKPFDPAWLKAQDWNKINWQEIDLRQSIASIDHQIAEAITKTAQEGIKLPEVNNLPKLDEVGSASISAQISTTPEEFWDTLREEGSQAVLSDLAKNAEVSVNNMSVQMMNEARYQYCQGVVKEYERQRQSE